MANTGLPLRGELTRAYQRFFGTRGGFTPAAFKEIMPVQIMDTESWPTSRKWVVTETSIAVAAQVAFIIVENTDPADSGSLIIIDWLRMNCFATSDVVFGLVPSSSALGYNGAGPFAAVDLSPSVVSGASPVQAVSNVQHGTGNAAAVGAIGGRWFNVATYELSPAMPRITIPPQCKFILACVLVNTQHSATIGGRYYSAL